MIAAQLIACRGILNAWLDVEPAAGHEVVGLRVAETLDRVNAVLKPYGERELAVMLRHAETVEGMQGKQPKTDAKDGRVVFPTPEAEAACKAQIDELLEADLEIAATPLSLRALVAAGYKVSARAILTLGDLLARDLEPAAAPTPTPTTAAP